MREKPTEAPPFRTGDMVRHRPTGETWVVAYADPSTGYMAWCGWPAGRALITDCTLTEAADDEAHQRWLREVVNSTDFRANRARALYGDPAGHSALAAHDGGQDNG